MHQVEKAAEKRQQDQTARLKLQQEMSAGLAAAREHLAAELAALRKQLEAEHKGAVSGLVKRVKDLIDDKAALEASTAIVARQAVHYSRQLALLARQHGEWVRQVAAAAGESRLPTVMSHAVIAVPAARPGEGLLRPPSLPAPLKSPPRGLSVIDRSGTATAPLTAVRSPRLAPLVGGDGTGEPSLSRQSSAAQDEVDRQVAEAKERAGARDPRDWSVRDGIDGYHRLSSVAALELLMNTASVDLYGGGRLHPGADGEPDPLALLAAEALQQDMRRYLAKLGSSGEGLPADLEGPKRATVRGWLATVLARPASGHASGRGRSPSSPPTRLDASAWSPLFAEPLSLGASAPLAQSFDRSAQMSQRSGQRARRRGGRSAHKPGTTKLRALEPPPSTIAT